MKNILVSYVIIDILLQDLSVSFFSLHFRH